MRSSSRAVVLLVAVTCGATACELFLPLDESGANGGGGDGNVTNDGNTTGDGSVTSDGQAAADQASPDGSGMQGDGGASTDAMTGADTNSSLYDSGTGSTSYCQYGGVHDVFCADFDESADASFGWSMTAGQISLDMTSPPSAPAAGHAADPMTGPTSSTLTSPSFGINGATKATLLFSIRIDSPTPVSGDPWTVAILHLGAETVSLEWKSSAWNFYDGITEFSNAPAYSLSPGTWYDCSIEVTTTGITVKLDYPVYPANPKTKSITLGGLALVTLGVTGTDTSHDRGIAIDNVRLTIE